MQTNILNMIEHKNKKSIFYFLKNSSFFLGISLINSIMPIVLCIIAAFIPSYGAQATMGVGYVATFLLSFSQVGISFATSTYFLTKKKITENKIDKKEFRHEVMTKSIVISLAMSIFLLGIYALSSYLYMHYSCDRPNTMQTLDYGLEFMYTSIGYIFLICTTFLLLLYIKMNSRILGNILTICSFLFIAIFTAIMGLYTGLEAKGIGLGLSLSTVIVLIVSATIISIKFPFKMRITKILKFNRDEFKEILTESVPGVSLSLFKGLAIFILAICLPKDLTNYVPLSYQMARLIWFNIMYAIVWFPVGISDTIKFYFIGLDYDVDYKVKIKLFWKLLLISMCVTLVFAIASWFVVEPLASLYITNGAYNFDVQGVPQPSESLAKYLGNPPSGHKYWTPELIMGLKEPKRNFLHILLHENLRNDFFIFVKKFEAYTTYDKNIITALLNHNFSSMNIHDIFNNILNGSESANNESIKNLLILISLDGYNTNSTFYIYIYAVMSCIWTVLMPATKAITKKSMSNLFVASVYAFFLGFLIFFGTWYSIIDTNPNNTFRYLDAWTFPLIIIAISVSLVIFTKWVIVIREERHKDQSLPYFWNKIIKKHFVSQSKQNINSLSLLMINEECSRNDLKILDEELYKMIEDNIVLYNKKSMKYYLNNDIKNYLKKSSNLDNA